MMQIPMIDSTGRPVPDAKRTALSKASDFMGAAEAGMRARRQVYEALLKMPSIGEEAIEAARLDVMTAMELVLDAQRDQHKAACDCVYPNG